MAGGYMQPVPSMPMASPPPPPVAMPPPPPAWTEPHPYYYCAAAPPQLPPPQQPAMPPAAAFRASASVPPWDPTVLRESRAVPGPGKYDVTHQNRISFNAKFTPDPDTPGYGKFAPPPLAPINPRLASTKPDIVPRANSIVRGAPAVQATIAPAAPPLPVVPGVGM